VWAWKRLALVGVVFALGLAEALYDWHVHPPVAGLSGASTYGRNVPGDLGSVLRLYLIEGLIAVAALQPWRVKPDRAWMGAAAGLFAAWGALQWLVDQHAPAIMLRHDLLVLVVAVVLGGTTLVFSSESLSKPTPKP
jgi:hypothetical protein